MDNQISIRDSVKIDGINIYNGNKNSVTFHHAKEGSGIIFVVGNTRIPAKLKLAIYRKKAIGLDYHGESVDGVEHLLSAVYALKIDNLIIELSDGVCPETDNCAQEFFDALKNIRIEQATPKKFWRYKGDNELSIKSDDKIRPDHWIIKPSNDFIIDYSACYPHKVVGEQKFRFKFSEGDYRNQIAEARSPCFTQDSLSKQLFFMPKSGLGGVNGKNFLLIG
ncbi:MAG: UDP-3-O-acyl-N-acetylglucosamine deacetylase [Candidatus Nanoarchaeia archaeon]|nr:UDP-3-O-acyl-N-acetylglucosamine deacetylase [Candidatus Nanoarchaeia archaeon]